jgi:hypothetical protein
MPETITLQALDLSGETLTLFLRKSDGTLLNTGGDAMTESGSTGVFTATLAESRSGLGPLAVRICAGSETADNLLYDGFLVEGTTVIDSVMRAELDSDVRVKLASTQPDYAPATTTALTAVANNVTAILEDTGTTLPAQISGISGGSGSGARTVTITVNDGTTVLQNALIRLTEGANTFTATTNASGVATFNVDDATYTVAITKSGYSYAGTTLVVDGAETRTYSMTQVSVTPPTDPALSAIEVLCLGTAFTAQSGIDIDFRMSSIASGDQDKAYPGAKVTVTSNGSGIARWEAPRGATIEYKRGTAQVWTRATLDSDSLTSVTSVIGSP